jgi:hypothetical protein
MADDKDIRWAEGHDTDDTERDVDAVVTDDESTRDGRAWEAYRKWLSHRGEKRRNRGTLDPSLYTWKGYRNWTEEVKRNWSDRHQDDHDEK